MTRRSRIIGIVVLLLGIGTLSYAAPYLMTRVAQYRVDQTNSETMEMISSEDIVSGSGATTDQSTIPPRAYLNVPFTPQAPFANWNIHEESCEEAALLQVRYYLLGKSLSATEADSEIQKMLDWQKAKWGNQKDLYADEMRQFIIDYYGYAPEEVIIIKDASLEDLKQQIAQGHPIIAPITGTLLKNPWYHFPGYHMLTIIGYTEDRIITNDVGTKRGKDFTYENERFMNALRDASGDVIVIVPNTHATPTE